MPRRFNRRQRSALYVAADGRCVQCGTILSSGWHTDHVKPWSAGGETDVTNGQALCPKCNQEKGDSMPSSWIDELRDWQIDAFARYQNHRDRNFLVVATPGAGKTKFSLRVVHYWLQAGLVRQVVIVCPTEHLKKQWAGVASSVGIQIDPYHSSGDPVIKAGFQGIAVTYQQVGFSPDLFRHITSKRTAVIFDEIHHAGDRLTWGEGIKRAFEYATHRLALSGTPFRSDNNAIPFVTYTPEGRSEADYEYTYADSLRDDVCRYVFFPKYEGEMEWLSRQGELRRASFKDQLNEREQAERLRTAISANGNWLKQVIKDAHDRLLTLRANGHDNAGGLIIAMDQNHAERIAEIVQAMTGVMPVLAISDNPDASAHIELFAESSDCWVVAVKMISEGVDIPRLRVLVYATNVQSELFFRQAVGRIVRSQPDVEEQNAYFYMPDDPTLIGFAQAIKEERDHQLEEPDDTYADPATGEIREIPRDYEPSLFQAIQAEARADGAIIGSFEYTQEELDQAREAGKAAGMPHLAPEAIALFMRMARSAQSNEPTGDRPEARSAPLYKKLKLKKKVINAKIAHYASLTNLAHEAIHTMWVKMGRGHKWQSDPTITLDELDEKLTWIVGLIKKWSQP